MARGATTAVFLGMLVTFSILRPDSFPTPDNLQAILDQAAIFAILGCGLTVVLTIGEFDLSFEAAAAIAGSAAVAAMVQGHQGAFVAILAAVGVGLAVGVTNGVIIAYGRVPAFIATLAVASLVAGIELWFTGGGTIYEGVSLTYQEIGSRTILGIPLTIVISIACVLVTWLLMSFTVYGRRAHAVGSNTSAALLAGIRVQRIRLVAFAIMGLMAGIAGIIITARAGGSFPNSAIGVLLPTYTAAFLGAAALRGGQFHPLATYFGVLFIGSLQTGLTMLQAAAWVAQVITGAVLVIAVWVALRQR